MVAEKSHEPSSKSKRQRRSYSCGPCKLLKIKCDLALPCSSCVKLKRVDKCKLAPPNPPSADELRVIEERKNRLSKRHQKPSTFDRNGPYKSSSSTESPQTSVAPTTFSDDAVNWHDHLMLHLNAGPGNFALLQSNTIDIDTIPVIPSHKLSNGHSIFRTDLGNEFEDMIPLAPEEFKDLVTFLPTPEQAAVLIEKYLKSVNQDLFELIDFKYITRWVFPLIHYATENKNQKTIALNKISIRVLSCLLAIIATGLLITPSMKIKNFDSDEVIRKYVDLSRKLKNNLKCNAGLLDIIHLMIWYLVIETYYTYSNSIQEHYFEYTTLLSTLLFNERCMKCIVNKDITADSPELEVAEFKLVSKFWFRLRIIELEISYFQYKSSLLNSNLRFKNSIAPNTKYLNLVYDKGLSEVKFDLQNFAFRSTIAYFDQFTESDIDFEKIKLEKPFIQNSGHNLATAPIDVVKLVKSYLTIYSKCYLSVKPDMESMDRMLSSPQVSRNYNRLVSEEALGLYMKSQLVALIFAKWLSFVKVESSYFPSLRYCTYLTSMLCMFNHFNRLDDIVLQQTYGKSNLLEELTNTFNYYHFRGMVASYVFTQFFLMVLKNFTCARAQDQADCSFDVRRYFDAVNYSFTTTFQKFLGYFNNSPLSTVPCYKSSIKLVCEMSYIYNNVIEFNGNLNINHFLNLVATHLHQESWNVLVEHHFGSKTTLIGYMDCLWECLKFLICTPSTQRLPMLSTVTFNADLIMSFQHSLMGFRIDDEVIDDYIEVVVKPGVT